MFEDCILGDMVSFVSIFWNIHTLGMAFERIYLRGVGSFEFNQRAVERCIW